MNRVLLERQSGRPPSPRSRATARRIGELSRREALPFNGYFEEVAQLYYVSLPFLTFAVLDYELDPELLRQALFEKRYALAGLAAGLLLVPLAITATRG